jgi:spore photoproduct lyase
MSVNNKKKKYREAALKAWKTIRKRKRERAAKNSKKITEFIHPKVIGEIKHPEMVDFEEPTKFEWKGNRIVVLFQKTPLNIACGKFWELRWAYGCPLNCSYCYLRGTTRGRMKPQYVKTIHVLKALDEAFTKIREPSIFNAGELSDALMNPTLMVPIIEKFEEQNKHKIYLLTKFGIKNIKFLLSKPKKQVICAWSINVPIVAKLWETTAPTPDERIAAAKAVSDIGYDTRIRIDPIFPIRDWKPHYANLIDQILSSLTPRRIILGTPRGLWKTIKYAKEAGVDMSWAQYFKEDTEWGKKLAFEQRKEIYQFIYDKLNSAGYPLHRVSICKETVDMWKALRLHYIPRVCNCYGNRVLHA